jgi:DNA-binding MarR family transcriptional regulator
MANRIRASTERSSPLRRFFVSDDDVEAARKLLGILTETAPLGPGEPPGGKSGELPDRNARVQNAQEWSRLRQRRIQELGMPAETPFAVLIALYTNEEWEPVVTLTRLTQLAWLSMSTMLRSLDVLFGHGWIVQQDDPNDLRKSLLSLTPKGRAMLDALFGEQETVAG